MIQLITTSWDKQKDELSDSPRPRDSVIFEFLDQTLESNPKIKDTKNKTKYHCYMHSGIFHNI